MPNIAINFVCLLGKLDGAAPLLCPIFKDIFIYNFFVCCKTNKQKTGDSG